MENTTKKVKITKVENLLAIKAMLTGEEVPSYATTESIVDFIDKEVALLRKKNVRSADEETLKRNAESRNLIMAFLEGQTEGVTCTQIINGIPELAGISNQKVNALMTVLEKDEKKVTRYKEKGKSLFKVKVGE